MGSRVVIDAIGKEGVLVGERLEILSAFEEDCTKGLSAAKFDSLIRSVGYDDAIDTFVIRFRDEGM